MSSPFPEGRPLRPRPPTAPKVVVDDPCVPRQRLARGTTELSSSDQRAQHALHPRDAWHLELRLELLGRNLSVAGGLRMAYCLGRSHEEFEAHRRPTAPRVIEDFDEQLTLMQQRPARPARRIATPPPPPPERTT